MPTVGTSVAMMNLSRHHEMPMNRQEAVAQEESIEVQPSFSASVTQNVIIENSTSHDTTSNETSSMRRNVSFDKVEIRGYGVTLSDNPAVTTGPPVQLGWDYDEEPTMKVEDFESSRCPVRRSKEEMQVPPLLRETKLRQEGGHSRKEILQMTKEVLKVQASRKKNANESPLKQRRDEILESTRKSITGYKRKEKSLLRKAEKSTNQVNTSSSSLKKGILKKKLTYTDPDAIMGTISIQMSPTKQNSISQHIHDRSNSPISRRGRRRSRQQHQRHKQRRKQKRKQQLLTNSPNQIQDGSFPSPATTADLTSPSSNGSIDEEAGSVGVSTTSSHKLPYDLLSVVGPLPLGLDDPGNNSSVDPSSSPNIEGGIVVEQGVVFMSATAGQQPTALPPRHPPSPSRRRISLTNSSDDIPPDNSGNPCKSTSRRATGRRTMLIRPTALPEEGKPVLSGGGNDGDDDSPGISMLTFSSISSRVHRRVSRIRRRSASPIARRGNKSSFPSIRGIRTRSASPIQKRFQKSSRPPKPKNGDKFPTKEISLENEASSRPSFFNRTFGVRSRSPSPTAPQSPKRNGHPLSIMSTARYLGVRSRSPSPIPTPSTTRKRQSDLATMSSSQSIKSEPQSRVDVGTSDERPSAHMVPILITSQSVEIQGRREDENADEAQVIDSGDDNDLEEAQSMDSTVGFGQDHGDEEQSIDSLGKRLEI